MSKNTNILKSVSNYIDKYNIDSSPEEMFLHFEQLATLHREFEAHLNNEKLYFRLNAMKRSERLKSKRKLFMEWYIEKYQNQKILKEMVFELSEMAFVTTRTVENNLFYETTENTGEEKHH